MRETLINSLLSFHILLSIQCGKQWLRYRLLGPVLFGLLHDTLGVWAAHVVGVPEYLAEHHRSVLGDSVGHRKVKHLLSQREVLLSLCLSLEEEGVTGILGFHDCWYIKIIITNSLKFT